MKNNLTDKLWKSSNIFFQKDEDGWEELNAKGVILGAVFVIVLLVLGGWVVGGL